MRHIWFLLLMILTGCGTVRYVPVERKLVVRDTVVLKSDTVRVLVPAEKIVEVVPKTDTILLETSVAKAEAWVDSTGLHGKIENKRVELKKEIKVVERVRKVTERVEVPVEVIKENRVIPKWLWLSLAVNLAVVVCIVLKIRRLWYGRF